MVRAAATLRYVSCGTLVLLVACAPRGPNWQAINEATINANRACKGSAGQNGHLAIVECTAPKVREIYIKGGVSDIDVVDALWAKYAVIAEQEDAGKLTSTEAMAAAAQAESDVQSVVKAR